MTSMLLYGMTMLESVLTRVEFLTGFGWMDGNSIIHLRKYLSLGTRLKRLQFILLNRFADDAKALKQHHHVECKHKVESQQANLADDEGEPVEDRGGSRCVDADQIMQNGNFGAAENYDWNGLRRRNLARSR